MRSLLVSLAMASALVACDPERAVSDADKAALQQHEAQWDARSFHSYSFDYSEAQFSTNYNVHITVQADTVAEVLDSQTGQPPAVPRTWPTIDGLFNEADLVVEEGGFSISLEYDDQYGYPTLIDIASNNAGGGLIARSSNLQPIE
jgi:Family of unknown function (DUF6174)/PI31 proteasome regulator N-terminal